MRRIVSLFVVALVGAFALGMSSSANGLRVNSSGVSANTFRTELAAISKNPVLQCYLTALSPQNYGAGAGGETIAASGAVAWTNMRVQGLAISHYVANTLHHTPSAADLAAAQTSLEAEMTSQATQNQLSCPGTAAAAVAAMTPEMRQDQLRDWANSLYLEQKLNSTIPLTSAALQSYYAAHVSDYDTLCVSVALVDPTKVAAFEAAAKAGMSVADLAKNYSLDASGKKGGAYGCYSPSNSAYSSVRQDAAGSTNGLFTATPQYLQLQSGTYALFVAVTKRTTTPYAEASAAVLADVRAANATSASTIEKTIEYQAAVAIDPAFGNWGLSSSGPSVFAPQVPAKSDTLGATSLVGNPATYK